MLKPGGMPTTLRQAAAKMEWPRQPLTHRLCLRVESLQPVLECVCVVILALHQRFACLVVTARHLQYVIRHQRQPVCIGFDLPIG